jgi:hypothetical protein
MRTCLVLSLLATALAAADQVRVEADGPVSSTIILQPLSIEEAQKWHLFSQVKVVTEKESVLVDTMEAKNQVFLVHSISYFKGAGGQLYAIVNYLRPRVTPGQSAK